MMQQTRRTLKAKVLEAKAEVARARASGQLEAQQWLKALQDQQVQVEERGEATRRRLAEKRGRAESNVQEVVDRERRLASERSQDRMARDKLRMQLGMAEREKRMQETVRAEMSEPVEGAGSSGGSAEERGVSA